MCEVSHEEAGSVQSRVPGTVYLTQEIGMLSQEFRSLLPLPPLLRAYLSVLPEARSSGRTFGSQLAQHEVDLLHIQV